MKVPKDKFILDACCGSRFMWNNKKHPNTLYIDKRIEKIGYVKSRPKAEVNPDIKADFTDLHFIKDKTFKLIVWDPPHMIDKSIRIDIQKKYGILNNETWPFIFEKGFKELWRVLKDNGILIFKFNDAYIDFKKVLKLFPEDPLFSNTTNVHNKSVTKWFTFMKIPKNQKGGKN